MPENKYLVRSVLLNPRQQVLGYKLGWQQCDEDVELTTNQDLHQLLACVAAHVGHTQSVLLILDADPQAAFADALQVLSPQNTVLVLNLEDFRIAENIDLAILLHKRGFGLALRNVNLALLQSNKTLLRLIKHVEIDATHLDLVAICALAKNNQPPFFVVLEQSPSWQEEDVYVRLGVHRFVGDLAAKADNPNVEGQLGPQTGLILQLMQMVQKNADIRELEKMLQRDATLSYKLFRYIKSVGFGMRVEIQSIRHAVTMMGYLPLFRWLSVLLSRSSATGFSPALLQAAMIRGRFAELLGQGLLSKSDAENLFFVGMFSLLDQLIGIPMPKVLSQIVLPDAVSKALLSREGIYGPFLTIAQSCEQQQGQSAKAADALFLSASAVNQAHLSALVWAQSHKP